MDKNENSTKILEVLSQVDRGIEISEETKTKLLEVKSLSLNGLNLLTLPESIGLLENLSILDVSSNQILKLPESIGSLSQLQDLNVSDNQLNTLPESIYDLNNLDTLLVSNNNLIGFPEFLIRLHKLRMLDCSYNEITQLPSDIFEMQSLEMLSCSFNRITKLPDSLGYLPKLTLLDLAGNPIYHLPQSLGKLKNLHYMDLSKLHLHSIPEAIVDCKLNFVFEAKDYVDNGGILLADTVLDTQPIAVFYENRETIVNYYKVEHIEISTANVFFLGDAGVGKTYLINRLWSNSDNSDTCQTRQINCINRLESCNNKEINMKIWDFGGQSIFHSIYPLFLKKNSCYIIVVSNRTNNFDCQIDYWLNVISRYASGTNIIIVENNFGGLIHSNINIEKLERKYSASISYLSINAHQDDNLSCLKNKILAKVATLNYPVIPSKWEKITNGLISYADTNSWMGIEEYEELCKNCGIQKNETKKELLNWLNNAGLCFYFDLSEKSRKIIVLSPAWLAGLYYSMLNLGPDYSVNATINENGLLKCLDSIENETVYTKNEMDYIIDIYEHFRLVKRVSEYSVYIPALLPVNNNLLDTLEDLNNKYPDKIKYELEYPYIPDIVMNQLMIMNYNILWFEYSSRSDLVFHYFDDSALAVISKNKNALIVEVLSKGIIPKGILLQAILKDIKSVISSWRIHANEYVYVEFNGNSEKLNIDQLLHLNKKEKYYIGEYSNYPIEEILYNVYGITDPSNIQLLGSLNSKIEDINKKLELISNEKKGHSILNTDTVISFIPLSAAIMNNDITSITSPFFTTILKLGVSVMQSLLTKKGE